MEEYRTLDLTIISADDLKNVNLFSNMDVYVVVSLADSITVNDHHRHHSHNTLSKQRTPLHKKGHKNPTWNFPVKFTISAAENHYNHLSLHFDIRSRRRLFPSDKLVGNVVIPISCLISTANRSQSHVSYQVRRPSGKPKGVLNLSFKFGVPEIEPSTREATAYPVTRVRYKSTPCHRRVMSI